MVIVGGGGFAEEFLSWLSPIQLSRIDGYVASHENNALPLEYLGTFEDIRNLPQQEFLIGVGTPQARLIAIQIVKEAGKKFSSFTHSTATVAKSAKLGNGVLIGPYCFVSAGADLGDLVFMNCYSSVGHHSKLGERVILNPYSAITGNCLIGEDCVLGLSSSILPKVKLPVGTKVAPGSAVYRSVAEACTLIGVPAKAVRGL